MTTSSRVVNPWTIQLDVESNKVEANTSKLSPVESRQVKFQWVPSLPVGMRRQWWWVVHQTNKHRPQWPSYYNIKAKAEPQGSNTHLQSFVTFSPLRNNLGAKFKANQTWMQVGCKQYLDGHPSNTHRWQHAPFSNWFCTYINRGLTNCSEKGKTTKLHKAKLDIPFEPIVAFTHYSQFSWIKCINNKLEHQQKARWKSIYTQH